MRSAIWRRCSGEAHTNAYTDHCWTCAPYWEIFPACPDCTGKVTRAKRVSLASALQDRARCTDPACASYRRWFDTSAEPHSDTYGRFALIWSEIAFCFSRGIK